jgi:hypothetical protein
MLCAQCEDGRICGQRCRGLGDRVEDEEGEEVWQRDATSDAVSYLTRIVVVRSYKVAAPREQHDAGRLRRVGRSLVVLLLV